MGHDPGAVPQAGELGPDAAAEAHGHEGRHDHRDQAEAARQGQLGDQAVTEPRGLGAEDGAELAQRGLQRRRQSFTYARKACGFTGIGRLAGLFSILVSIARSWR